MYKIRLAGVAFLTLAHAALCQTPPALVLQGVDGPEIRLTTQDLAKLPQHTFTVTDHDQPVTFQGVALSDLCAKMNVPSGEALRGKLLALYLLVEGADGYQAVFALPEFDGTFTDRAIFLATARDGKPLPDTEGPFHLIVPGEKRPSRWIRQVTALRIRMAN